MKKSLLFFPLLFTATNATAESRSGYLKRIFADPSAVVLVLVEENNEATNGECGSNYYHIPKTNENFDEFFSIMLAAAAAQKRVDLQTSSCGGSKNFRNILSHGSVIFI